MKLLVECQQRQKTLVYVMNLGVPKISHFRLTLDLNVTDS